MIIHEFLPQGNNVGMVNNGQNTLYLFVHKVESIARKYLCPCLTTYSTCYYVIVPSMNDSWFNMNTFTSFFSTQYWTLSESSSWIWYRGSSSCFLRFKMSLLFKNASLPILGTPEWVCCATSIWTCLLCISRGETPTKRRDPTQCFICSNKFIRWSHHWC